MRTVLAIVMLLFVAGGAAAQESEGKAAARPSLPDMTVEEAQRIVDAQPASAKGFDAIQVLLRAFRVTPQNRGSWEQTTNAQVHRRLARLLVEHHLARRNFTEAAYLPYLQNAGEDIAYWEAIYAGAAQREMRGEAAVQILRKSVAQSNQSGVSDKERQRLREAAQRYLRIINEQYADVGYVVEAAQQSAKALTYSVGAKLPSVEVSTLTGSTDNLARYRGKVVLVEFWATWCPWCRHAFPQLAKLKEEMRGRPFEVIGISVDDKREQVTAFLKDKPEVSWTQWFAGPESPLLKEWGVLGYPTLLLVDADGVVRERTNEPHARLQEHVRRLVSHAEKPVPVAAVASPPPVSIADTLAFREIVQVQMKPDSSAVAFVARKPIVGTRENEDTLMLVSTAGGEPRSVLAGGSIELKSWDNGGRWLYALRRQASGTEVVRTDSHSGESRALWQAAQVVESLAISPDGRWCVAATRVARQSSAEHEADRGVVFEYGQDTFASLLLRSSTQWIDLFTIDTTSGATRRLARLPYEGFDHPARNYVEGITIAPDNLKAALVLSRIGEPARGGPPSNFDVAIVDLHDGQVVEAVPGSIHPEVAATWLGDSQRLFFFSNGEAQVYALKSGSTQHLPWAKLRSPFDASVTGTYERDSDSVSFAQTQSLGRVAFRTKRMTSEAGILDEASYSADRATYAFVSQAVDVRPAVAVREVKTGATRRLVDLNTYLDGRALGRVEKLTVTNTFGAKSVGFLIYPADYRTGQRYPLLLATYGFRGQFLLTAEWHTSFPAQALAGEGYAVLLLNLPSGVQSAQQLAGNPPKARENEGWQVLAAFEAAAKMLVERGIADSDKLGVYGWSHGAFIVQFLLAHSKTRFAAASLGEGGDYNPGEYWYSGGRTWPDIFRNVYGGPLTAKTVAAYLEFSPALNVDKVTTPLLMEYANVRNANYGAEFYVPLREQGVPAELVIYDDEEHNFKRPTVRQASMERKVDWFNYWMLGKEDPDPAKAGQYTRWRQMRTAAVAH